MSWNATTINGQTIFRCQELNTPAVIQAVSTKSSGNMALHTVDQPEAVIVNRQQFLSSLGLTVDNLVAAIQVHGTEVKEVSRRSRGCGARFLTSAIADTDALITRDKDVVLSIFTADCLPIFIFDPLTPAVGVVHAGWRGSIKGIAAIALDKMARQFQTDPGQCWVALGPAIGACCFQVNAELAEGFAKIFPEVVTGDQQNGYHVDLNLFNALLMQKNGVQPERIIYSGVCTATRSDIFYSYRAEQGTGGRLMGIIGLR